MKKIYSILMILAAAAGFTNCTKAELVNNKEAENGGTVVYATTDAVTKTTLANDYNVLWSDGDQIDFFKIEGQELLYISSFTLSSGAETTTGTFESGETLEDGEYIVYYPLGYDGKIWPNQNYKGPNDISGAPMKATATVSDGKVSDLAFTNEGGILRYTVMGDKTIKSINVKSGSTLDVTLDCGTSGVALKAEGTVFNIALPEGEYSNATLTFTATDNTVATKTASTFIVTKNVVSLATFEALDLSFVPDGFVDLGVTDANGKTLYWAECNLGASNPEDPGNYYMWGATQKIYTIINTSNQTAFEFVNENPYGIFNTTWDKTKGFCWDNTPFTAGVFKNNDGERNVFTRYTTVDKYAKNSVDNNKVLLNTDDAATVANSKWRTPTKDEFTALKNNCYCEWTDNYNGTDVNGVIVYKAKADGDKGKYNVQSGYSTSDPHIFLPAAGYGNGTSLTTIAQSKIIGDYFTSSLDENNNEKAASVIILSTTINISSSYRHYGYTIRPVQEVTN